MSVATSLADVLPAAALAEPVPAHGWAPPPGHFAARAPEALVRPESTEEVAATLRWAAANGVGVLPLGSGRRVRSAELDRPYVALSTERLAGIEIYEPADLTFTARAGTRLDRLGEELGAHGQWLPFDPPRVEERSLGGLVASGESGPTWMGYGELRNHVLGATVVTGDGRMLRLGGRVVKNVAGFDLLKVVVGSRGRLAVIASVCVRAFPRPGVDALLVLAGESAAALAPAARAVGTAPVVPVASVLVAPAAPLGAAAALLVRLHGSEATVAAERRALERHAGVDFERAERPGELLRWARDHASAGQVLRARVLPSGLEAAIGAACGLLAGGADAPASSDGKRPGLELVADTYRAELRVAAPWFEPRGVARLREEIERLGGVLAAPGIPGASTPPRPQESRLVQELERVFDPSGTLWPCRA